MKKTVVWWSTKRLAKEHGMSKTKVTRLLKAIGAEPWSPNKSGSNRMWYYGEVL